MVVCDLCKPCAETLKAEGKIVTFVSGGRDRKVFCSKCGRRRFGATYQVSGLKKPKPPKKVKAHAADRS